MELTSLTAISPIDGRYYSKTKALTGIFSEFALLKYRFTVEIEWFLALANNPEIPHLPALSDKDQAQLREWAQQFSVADAKAIKKIEATTNHDVKAVEYFLKEQMKNIGITEKALEFVHFACTSEDINNLAYSMMLRDAKQQCIIPEIEKVITQLSQFSHEHAGLAMLCRTHGQAATPSTLGKEFANFTARLKNQLAKLQQTPMYGKINGAVGNYNAHLIAYPNVDWLNFGKSFIEQLNLTFQQYTTQIEPHDGIANFANHLALINTIFIDLCRDCWSYVSLGYFQQKTVAGEVGSSTMPHKVNPIDFENAEGNLSLANALLNFFARELPTSRLQRDLTDSTILRNIGVALAHSLLAYQSLMKGLNKLAANQHLIESDLNNHYAVLAEAVQTVMRRDGIENPYEQLKALTRGKEINQASMHEFIQQLPLDETVKNELLNLTPSAYIGLAKQLAQMV